jgi:hypothetical protein
MIIGQTIQADWIVTNLTTGAEENATGTQTAVLFRNGSVVGAATPTVSNPGTAHYHASVLLDAAHSWAVGDHYSLVASWVEPGTSAKKKLILAQGVITDMATLAKQEEIIGDIAIAQTAIDAIPTNPMLDTEDGSSFSAIPDMATATNQSTLLGRLTAARAGYLDNLNVGGAVAAQTDIDSINQSASRRSILTVLAQWERPESGSFTKTIECRTWDGDGAPSNADGTPTIAVTGNTSGDLSANLSVASNPVTGVYRWTYTDSSAAVLEDIRIDVTPTIGGTAYPIAAFASVVDLVSATWTTTDASNLTAIFNKLPSASYLLGGSVADGSGYATPTNITAGTITTVSGNVGGNVNGNVVGNVGTLAGASTVVLTDGSLTTAKLGAFKLAKTTNITGFNDVTAASVYAAFGTGANLTAVGGDGSQLTEAGGTGDQLTDVPDMATATNQAAIAGYLDTEIAAILADTNELQTNQGNWLTADVSGLSTHSAADVRTELATELARIDVATSTRQATVPNLANVVTMAAQFSTMIIVNGSVYDFTAAALAAGPGGDATVAKQNEIIADIAAMQAAVDLLAGVAGPGGIAWEVTVNDSGGSPLGDVACWVTTDAAGSNVIAGTLYTTEFGIVTFMLNAGTYYLWRNSTSHDFTNPQVMVVS